LNDNTEDSGKSFRGERGNEMRNGEQALNLERALGHGKIGLIPPWRELRRIKNGAKTLTEMVNLFLK
jgi:hypothetical protein